MTRLEAHDALDDILCRLHVVDIALNNVTDVLESEECLAIAALVHEQRTRMRDALNALGASADAEVTQ